MNHNQTPFEKLKAKHNAMEGFKAALADYLVHAKHHGNPADYEPIDEQLELLELIPGGSKSDGTAGSPRNVQNHSAYRSAFGREVGEIVAKAAWTTLEQLLEVRDKTVPAANEHLRLMEQLAISRKFDEGYAAGHNEAAQKLDDAYSAENACYVKMMQLQYLLERYAPAVHSLFVENRKTNRAGMPRRSEFDRAVNATRGTL